MKAIHAAASSPSGMSRRMGKVCCRSMSSAIEIRVQPNLSMLAGPRRQSGHLRVRPCSQHGSGGTNLGANTLSKKFVVNYSDLRCNLHAFDASWQRIETDDARCLVIA